MKIWIADADITAALKLKKYLISDPFLKIKAPKFDLFYQFTDYQAALDSFQKDQYVRPQVIFYDPLTLNDEPLRGFVELEGLEPPYVGDFIVLTRMGFGRFQDICHRIGVTPPLFIAKSHFESKWPKIADLVAGNPPERKPATPQSRRREARLKLVLREFEDYYYAQAQFDLNRVRDFFVRLSSDADVAGVKELQGQAIKILQLLQQNRPPGVMRLRKEMKDYLTLAHKLVPGLGYRHE